MDRNERIDQDTKKHSVDDIDWNTASKHVVRYNRKLNSSHLPQHYIDEPLQKENFLYGQKDRADTFSTRTNPGQRERPVINIKYIVNQGA